MCGLCREAVTFDTMHVDHIIEVRKAGPTTAGNLRATHSRCNLERAGRPRLVNEAGRGLKPVSVKLWEDQVDFISAHENGNAWLRDVVAKAIRREQAKAPSPPKRRRKLS